MKKYLIDMSITKYYELIGMQKASEAVAYTLKEMTKYAQPCMTKKEPELAFSGFREWNISPNRRKVWV